MSHTLLNRIASTLDRLSADVSEIKGLLEAQAAGELIADEISKPERAKAGEIITHKNHFFALVVDYSTDGYAVTVDGMKIRHGFYYILRPVSDKPPRVQDVSADEWKAAHRPDYANVPMPTDTLFLRRHREKEALLAELTTAELVETLKGRETVFSANIKDDPEFWKITISNGHPSPFGLNVVGTATILVVKEDAK